MLNIQKSDLTAALDLTTKVVEARLAIPIMRNVMFTRDDQGIRITGSNLDVEVSTRAIATLGTAFKAFTAPAGMLKDIVSKLPNGDVAIELDKDSVRIKAGRSRFSLQTLPAADFPTLDAGELPVKLTLAADSLAGAIRDVSFAISNEETRYYLNGIYFHTKTSDASKLLLVATDGHRLARRAVDIGQPMEFPGVIVPAPAVQIIQRVIAKHETVTLEVSASKIRVTAGDTTIISKLIDGTFPDYERVIPTKNDKTALVPRLAFIEAASRVGVMASKGSSMVKLSMTPDTMCLALINRDNGTANEELPMKLDADGAEIGFNLRYLAEALDHVAGDEVALIIDDGGSPAILKSQDATDDLIVLMPMRVG